MVIHLKLGQENAEWRSRNSINMLIDKKMYWFCWFPASKKLSEIREMFKFVAYKEIKEELRNRSEEEIKEFYGDQGWFFAKIIFIKGKRFIYAYFADQKKLEEAVTNSLVTGHMEDVWIIPQKKKNFNTFISSGNDNPGLTQERISVGTSASSESKEKRGSEFIYTEKDMEEIVARAVEGHIKEKEMIKDNVNQSARELCKIMGLRLGTIDFSASNVNKDRQTQVLFEEIQKTNAEKIVTQKISKSATVVKSVDEEEVVDMVNKYRKGASSVHFLEKGSDTNGHVTPDKVIDVINDFRKKEKTGEVPVSEEDISLYNKVNQVCSSRLPEIKKEEISEEDKIGQKRCSKEELSRGSVSSDETDEESGSENIATIMAKKEKSAQGGKGKKGGKSKKRNKKKW